MKDLFGNKILDLDDLEKNAIQLLQDTKPNKCAFSGGKDSIVIKKLCQLANINCVYEYHNTTIDPPELIYYMRKYHKDVIWNNPKKPFFKELENRIMPSRIIRWCCDLYKESKNQIGDKVVIGVRAAESVARKKRWELIKLNTKNHITYICPILNWSYENVWAFIKKYELPYCELYDNGYKRLGCVGCPMTNKRKKEFEKFPGYEKQWKRAGKIYFDKMKNKYNETQDDNMSKIYKLFDNFEDYWHWYINSSESVENYLHTNEQCLGLLEMWS
jgi:phosphoadenosine phosphosulfate reductase